MFDAFTSYLTLVTRWNKTTLGSTSPEFEKPWTFLIDHCTDNDMNFDDRIQYLDYMITIHDAIIEYERSSKKEIIVPYFPTAIEREPLAISI